KAPPIRRRRRTGSSWPAAGLRMTKVRPAPALAAPRVSWSGGVTLVAPPRRSGAEPVERGVRGERLEAGDALLRRRVRAEEPEQAEVALARERVDDGELRRRRVDLHRDAARVRLQAPERAREGQRLARDERRRPVRLELVLAADGELDDHGRDRGDDGHGEQRERVAALVVATADAAEDRSPPDDVADHGDGAGHGRGERADEHVPVLDVGQLVGDDAFQLLLAHEAQNAGRAADDGVVGVAAGGERVGLLGRRDRDRGHGQARATAQPVHHLVELVPLPGPDAPGAVHAQHDAVTEPVHAEVHDRGQDEARGGSALPPDGTAQYDQQGGEPRHEHENLDAFHALPSTSGYRRKHTPSGAWRSSPERESGARRRRWASPVAIVTGVYAFGRAVGSPGLAGGAEDADVVREPALVMLVTAPFPGPMPTPENGGQRRERPSTRGAAPGPASGRASVPPLAEEEEAVDPADGGALVEAERRLPREAVLGEEFGGPGGGDPPLAPDAGQLRGSPREPPRERDEQVLPQILAQLDLGAGEQVGEPGAADQPLRRALRREAEVVDADVLGEHLEPAGRVPPDGRCDGLEADLPGGGAERG